MTTRPALEIAGVRVVLGSRDIVRDVSFSVSSGEIVGLFGPSGAGKSTVFGAIAGELACARGRIFLDGNDISTLPIWSRARLGLGYVPQGPSVLFDLTVRENLRTFASLAKIALKVEEWAREVELSPRLDVRAGSLSGGERRRLELARALLSSPRVLLCDEPFAGLGPSASSAIAHVLRERAASGVAVLLSDHHVHQALSVAHRALLLVDGAVEHEADAASFASASVVLKTYVGESEGARIRPKRDS